MEKKMYLLILLEIKVFNMKNKLLQKKQEKIMQKKLEVFFLKQLQLIMNVLKIYLKILL